MANARSYSIRSRLVTRLVAGSLLITGGFNTLLYFYLRDELIEQYDESLATEARAVAAALQDRVQDTPGPAQFAEIDESFPRLRGGRDVENAYLQVWSADDAVMLRSPLLAGADLPRHNVPSSPRHSHAYYVSLPDGRPGRAVEVFVDPIEAPVNTTTATTAMAATPTMPPSFWVVLAERTDEMDGVFEKLALTLLVVGAAVSACAAGLVVVGVRHEFRPFGAFSDELARLDADTLTHRFNLEPLADELRPTATRLNDLLVRLKSAFHRERRFAADVAHEMRTPIAELRTMAEVAQRWPPESTNEQTRYHGDVLSIALRMAGLVDALLTLMRSRGVRPQAGLEPLDLVAAVREACAPHADRAAKRGVSVRFDMPDRLLVRANSSVLLALLGNLFDNATVYAVPDTTILVKVEVDAEACARFSLRNASAGLSADDVTHVHEPFWRKDASRTGGEHVGLGLSIVWEYAASLGISYRCDLEPQDIFVVELTWPAAVRGVPELREAASRLVVVGDA